MEVTWPLAVAFSAFCLSVTLITCVVVGARTARAVNAEPPQTLPLPPRVRREI